jgi:hypothetical protein
VFKGTVSDMAPYAVEDMLGTLSKRTTTLPLCEKSNGRIAVLVI